MKPQGIFTVLLADIAAVWPEHCIHCPFGLMNGQKQLRVLNFVPCYVWSTPCGSCSVYLSNCFSDLWRFVSAL
jgi:hypothetical protein